MKFLIGNAIVRKYPFRFGIFNEQHKCVDNRPNGVFLVTPEAAAAMVALLKYLFPKLPKGFYAGCEEVKDGEAG